MQRHTYFAAFQLRTDKRADVAALLQRWTEASAILATGRPLPDVVSDPDVADADTGEAMGYDASRLTLTFGFGSTLFVRDGVDRYGLAGKRPSALVDLPTFNGDQLIPGRTGGGLVGAGLCR